MAESQPTASLPPFQEAHPNFTPVEAPPGFVPVADLTRFIRYLRTLSREINRVRQRALNPGRLKKDKPFKELADILVQPVQPASPVPSAVSIPPVHRPVYLTPIKLCLDSRSAEPTDCWILTLEPMKAK